MIRVIVSAFTVLAIMALCQIVEDNSQAAMPSSVESNLPTESAQQGLAMERMNLMPLAFTENKGQWDERVKFRANAGGATMWFTEDGVYYQFTRRIRQYNSSLDDPVYMPHEKFNHEPDSIEQLVIKASFVGANHNPQIVGVELMEHKCNYFIGNDPSKWRTDVPNYSSVLYKEIYSGIDVRFYGAGGGKAEYEFVASPGADMKQIRIEYEGTDAVSVDAGGRLMVRTAWGDVVAAISSPVDEMAVASCGLSLASKQTAGLDMPVSGTQHPTTRSLTLEYSTYLGGTGSDWGFDIAIDNSGAAYVTGTTHSYNFPTLNPPQPGFAGACDIFVTKLSNSGNSIVYSTFLGGDYFDTGDGIQVDGSGAAYITGYTESTDFPTVNPYQTHQGGADAYVAKLSSAGNELIYSTYIGGWAYDESWDIALDEFGSACITGRTLSHNFPSVNPFRPYWGGGDAFVTRLSSSGNSLVHSTCLGGTNSDRGYGIAVDGFGEAYVTGYTNSSDFPVLNPLEPTYQADGYVAFVTKFTSAGNSLVYSTYLGGSSSAGGLRIAADETGSAYVIGIVGSTGFPVLNPFQATFQGGFDVFVTKFSASGNSLLYSTYLGGSGPDYPGGLSVDAFGAAYVIGQTDSPDFPTLNPYQMDLDTTDAFVTKFCSSGSSLVYSTYLGGNDEDHGWGIAADSSGAAYVTGLTNSPDFPILNPYQTAQGSNDAFVAKLGGIACDDAMAVIEPDPAYIYYKFAFVPMHATIHVGNFVGDLLAPDVLAAEIEGVPATITAILPSYPGFVGEVLQLDIPIAPFLEGYGAPLDTTSQTFTVAGTFTDQTTFCVWGDIDLIGKSSASGGTRWILPPDEVVLHGDVDASGHIDIDDAATIISAIFQGGSFFGPLMIADCDCSHTVDIDDVVYLLAYIFSGGNAAGDPDGDEVPDC